jgi:hypothetical protein
LATSNKDFRIKNGLIVEGANATVSGNEVLTSASSIDDLSDVAITEPSNAQVLSYDAALSLWKNSTPASGGSGVTISATPPTDPTPTEGNLWFDSSNGTTYIYYDDFWVPVSPPIAGPPGPTGEPGIVVSNDEPLDTNVLWLDSDDPAISAIPAGGTTGQVLAKATNDNYNTEWTNLNTADISDLTASATEINSISSDTTGYTALSNGTSGITYQPTSHNAIINGAFDIWQRGTSFTALNGYGADRWYCDGGGTLTQRTTGGPVNSNFYARAAFPVNSYLNFVQVVESVNAKALWGKNATVQIKLRRSAGFTANLTVSLRKNSTANAGPLAAGWSIIAGQTLTPAQLATGTTSADWTSVSFSAFIPSDGTANSLQITVAMSIIQSSDHFYEMAEVQLEAGSVATPFKRNANSLQGELAACQRYYVRYSAASTFEPIGILQAFNASTLYCVLPLPVQMRVRPTSIEFSSLLIQTWGTGSDAITSLSRDTNLIGEKAVGLIATTGATMTTRQMYGLTTSSGSGFLGISAEII